MKITKEKIKEVEEEWQSNLLNWKSKRRQSSDKPKDFSSSSSSLNNHNNDNNQDSNTDSKGKIKTFSEILKEKSKSGARIGYNLHHYLDGEDDNEIKFDDLNDNDESNSSPPISSNHQQTPSLESNQDEEGNKLHHLSLPVLSLSPFINFFLCVTLPLTLHLLLVIRFEWVRDDKKLCIFICEKEIFIHYIFISQLQTFLLPFEYVLRLYDLFCSFFFFTHLFVHSDTSPFCL